MAKFSDDLLFYSAPYHGWLEVPLWELRSLKIDGEISPYSYMDRDNAYLEEDQDAEVYLAARKARGIGDPNIVYKNVPWAPTSWDPYRKVGVRIV